MRPIWKGGISFGLIFIPVKMYSATESTDLDLDMVTAQDHAPIRYARINKNTDKEVPWKEVTKAYKMPENGYVILDEEDFAKARPKRSDTIDISCFVNLSEIDTALLEEPYYLEPLKETRKTYAVLLQALSKSGKVGVAEFVLHNREKLVIIKAEKDVILLNRMRYPETIRSWAELDLPKKLRLNPKEVELAVQLIDGMSEKFEAKNFQDDYIKHLKKIIRQKAKNKEVTAVITEQEAPRPTEVDALMEQLEKSLEKIHKVA